jgi:hypothetical protein
MGEIEHKKIDKCYRTAKDDWVRFDIYIEGTKYSYFQEGDTNPKQGDIIEYAEISEKGKYKNLKNVALKGGSGSSESPTINDKQDIKGDTWKFGRSAVELMLMADGDFSKMPELIRVFKKTVGEIASIPKVADVIDDQEIPF